MGRLLRDGAKGDGVVVKAGTVRRSHPGAGMWRGSYLRGAYEGGYFVTSRDLIDRGYGEVADFLAIDNQEWNGDIVTNPPYAYAQEFVEKALSIIPEGKKVCMFLKLTFLEGKGRKHLFRTQPPARVWVSCSRLLCAMNGKFDEISGSATAYAWFVWVKGWKGETVIKWFN